MVPVSAGRLMKALWRKESTGAESEGGFQVSASYDLAS